VQRRNRIEKETQKGEEKEEKNHRTKYDYSKRK